MRPPRPTGVTVMGIIGIIYSTLFMLVCPLCCGISLVAVYPQLDEKFEEMAQQEEKKDNPEKAEQIRVMKDVFKAAEGNDTLKQPIIGIYAAYVILGAILFVGSIGLFSLQPWARTSCLLFSFLSLVWIVATIVITVTVVTPEMETVVKDIARQKGIPVNEIEQQNPIGQVVSLFCLMIPLLVMAITMLAVLMSSTASAAFNPLPEHFDEERPPPDDGGWGQTPGPDPWKKDDDGIQQF